jgi:hypothetical protein
MMYNNSEYPVGITQHDGTEAEVSRRDFFQQALRGAAVAGAGAFSAVMMSGPVQAQYGGWGGPNVWKSTAYYRDYPNGAASFIRNQSFTDQGEVSVPHISRLSAGRGKSVGGQADT